MIHTLIYLIQLTVVASFSAMIYLVGSRWLGRHSRRILMSGLLGVLGVTTLACLPRYVIFSIPCPQPAAVVASTGQQASSLEAVNLVNSASESSLNWLWNIDYLIVVVVSIVALFALFRVMSTLFGFFSMNCLVRSAKAVSNSKLQTAFREVVQADASFHNCSRLQRVGFVQSDDVSTASTFGTWKPVILLPSHWQRWSGEQLRAVIAHELEHVRQADFLSRMVTEFVWAAHFYHPLVRWIANQYRIEQENTADLAATRYLSRELYEQLLVSEGVKRSASQGMSWAPSFSFTSKSLLRRRIEMLRQRLLQDERSGKRVSFWVMACVVPLTILLCGVHANAQQDTENTNPPIQEAQDENSNSEKKNGFTFEFKWSTDFDGEFQEDAELDQKRSGFEFFFNFPSKPQHADEGTEAEEPKEEGNPSDWIAEFYLLLPKVGSDK